MFGFFVDDIFSGFWANEVGDIFAEATISYQQWEKTKTKLYFYPQLTQEDLRFSKLDGFNVRVMESNNEDAPLKKLCEGDLFYSNGAMLIPC